LPDVDAACEEAVRALDDLHADGVVLMTNYRDLYLGDERLEPLMQELERRSALVVLHPEAPTGWEEVAFGAPAPMIEFPFDTTRTVARLILTGVLGRYPNIKLVVPHTGAALTVLVDRIALVAKIVAGRSGSEPIDVVGQLRRICYDVAGAPLPHALPALLALAGPQQLVYGSDLPPTPAPPVFQIARDLMATDLLSEAEKMSMMRGNGLKLVPRLAQSGAAR
jgi:predicted TIM-barrel fold metal-dependent hydrolase